MENTENYLECERNRVYYTLIAIAGFFGAYTFLLRGKVFCNAQTGNLVLLGLAIGQEQWDTAASSADLGVYGRCVYLRTAAESGQISFENPLGYSFDRCRDGNRFCTWACA